MARRRAAWGRHLADITVLSHEQLVPMQAAALKAAKVSLSRYVATQRRAFATWIAQSPDLVPTTIYKMLKLPPRHEDELVANGKLLIHPVELVGVKAKSWSERWKLQIPHYSDKLAESL